MPMNVGEIGRSDKKKALRLIALIKKKDVEIRANYHELKCAMHWLSCFIYFALMKPLLL